MKKVFSSIFPAGSILVLMLFGACSKKIDEAYVNPNADVRKPVEQLLPGIIANMTISNSAAGTNFGTQNDMVNIGRYIQFWAANADGNQFDRMGPQEPFSNISSALGAVWGSHYFGMGMNLVKMIEWAAEEKKWDYVGVGYAIKAWSWLTLTNMYGEVILHTAFQDRLTFPYDPQADVYVEVRRLCHEALQYLGRTGDGVSQTNLALGDQYMNNGDVEKWKKFTYAVLARSFNQLSNKPEYNADSVIKYCDMANMQTNAGNTVMRFSQTGGNAGYSFFAAFRGNFNTLRQSRFIAQILGGINPALPTSAIDPRAPYLIRENENTPGTYRGVRPNKGTNGDGLVAADRPRGFNGQVYSATANPTNDADSRYVFKNDAVFPIITASEVQFMKAEALYRKGLKADALSAYTLAVNLNFDMLVANYEYSVPAGLRMTPATRNAYFSDPDIIPANANDLTLSKIMLQKFIALYAFGAIETWVDLRRYHYNADTENGVPVYQNFEIPSSTDLWPSNRFKLVQRCYPRGASEAYNLPELLKVTGGQIDYHTKEQWFSE